MNATNGINKSEYTNINIFFFIFAFKSQNYDCSSLSPISSLTYTSVLAKGRISTGTRSFRID